MTSLPTSDQVVALRTDHYEGAAYFIAGPQAVVFAARVNGTPTTSDFAQVTFDTVTTGTYTDCVISMDVRISHTNDITAAFFIGRVRLTPTSSILYINETSSAIVDNDYIFVNENRPLVIRQRYKTFVDYSLTYTALPPIESNVDSAYVVCTTAATATFSLSSIGQALEKSATISSVLWTISGATYTVGGSTTADITFHVPTPYNKWASLKLTDSNGTTNTLWFTITAGNPDVDTFFRLCHEDVPISADWNNGYSTSLTFWADISDLLDRTRITIVSVETFDLVSLGLSSAVQFVGYLKTSTSNTQGDDKYGQKKDVQFEINGLMQLAGSLRFNQIAIRHNSSPTIWDEINIPTYQRNICHILAHHSTLLNLISMDFGTIDDTFSSGNTDVSETSLIDACRAAIKEVNGYLINDRAGKISLIRDPRVGSNTYRATLPDLTPSAIDLGDGFSFKLIDNPYDTLGWLEVGFAVIQPTTLARAYIRANAPASGPGDGNEDDQNPSQLLAATANLTDALIEARQRTGDLFALANTHRTIEWVLTSGWGGVVSPTCGVYYQFTIAAADDVRGKGVSSVTDWLCISTSMTINRNGTQEITATFTEVTQGGAVLINAAISPSVVTTPIPVLPVLSAYPAFPPAPSINYDSINPTNKIPRDPFSGMQNLPLKAEEAAAAANAQAAPGCSVTQVSFRNSSAVNTGFTSVLHSPYTIHITGSAELSSAEWQYNGNFVLSDEGFIPFPTIEYGTWVSGTGWLYTDALKGGLYRRSVAIVRTISSSVLTYVAFTYDITKGTYYTDTRAIAINADVPFLVDLLASQIVDGTHLTVGWSGVTTPVTSILFLTNSSVNLSAIYDGYALQTSFVVRGTGTNPFTGAPATPLHGDAFYTWQLDSDGNPINVTPNTAGGVRIDNNPIATFPPWNENSTYDVTLKDFNGDGGTGSTLAIKFLDSDYTDNAATILSLQICGTNAGS